MRRLLLRPIQLDASRLFVSRAFLSAANNGNRKTKSSGLATPGGRGARWCSGATALNKRTRSRRGVPFSRSKDNVQVLVEEESDFVRSYGVFAHQHQLCAHDQLADGITQAMQSLGVLVDGLAFPTSSVTSSITKRRSSLEQQLHAATEAHTRLSRSFPHSSGAEVEEQGQQPPYTVLSTVDLLQAPALQQMQSLVPMTKTFGLFMLDRLREELCGRENLRQISSSTNGIAGVELLGFGSRSGGQVIFKEDPNHDLELKFAVEQPDLPPATTVEDNNTECTAVVVRGLPQHLMALQINGLEGAFLPASSKGWIATLVDVVVPPGRYVDPSRYEFFHHRAESKEEVHRAQVATALAIAGDRTWLLGRTAEWLSQAVRGKSFSFVVQSSEDIQKCVPTCKKLVVFSMDESGQMSFHQMFELGMSLSRS